MIYISVLSVMLTFCAVYCFRLIPAKWLCDYNEKPSEIHNSLNRKVSLPVIILLSALSGIAGALFHRNGYNLWVNLSFCVSGAILMLIAVCDFKYSIIPNELLALCLAFGLPLALRSGWQQPLYGFLIGGVGLFAVIFAASKLLKAEAMGMGDLLLSALCGILCGAFGYAAMFFTAVITAGIFFSFLIIIKKVDKKSSQPFGPFLVIGAFSALCLQVEWQSLFNWYLGF